MDLRIQCLCIDTADPARLAGLSARPAGRSIGPSRQLGGPPLAARTSGRLLADVATAAPLGRLRPQPGRRADSYGRATSTPPTVRLPRRSTRNRPCSRSAGSGSALLGRDLDVVQVRAALRDRPPGRRLARRDPGRGHQVGHRGQARRCPPGRSRAAPRPARRPGSARPDRRRSPWPNRARLAAVAWRVSSAPCTSVVTSSASTRWATRAAGRSAICRSSVLDLLAGPEA